MRGPSFQINSDDDDDVVDLTKSTFQIQRPSPPYGVAGPNLGTDMLINKRKVSNEVMSLSSSSRDGSEYSDSNPNTPNRNPSPKPQQMGGLNTNQSANSYNSYRPQQPQQTHNQSSSEDESTESENGQQGQNDSLGDRFRSERSRLESEIQEKKEILYQMDRLEAKGYKLPRNFSMQSDIEEMRGEYHRIVREKEIDASVRFQRKIMMTIVSSIEFLNGRFDPFSAKLDGWSEQVHDNVNDYDDIFEELHEKYKGSGQKMAPELRLMLALSGSAFTFHLTNSMFKQSKLPGVEEVIRSNPDLMKQFQAAAMNKMASNNAPVGPPPGQSGLNGGAGPNIFSMMGNMFGMGSGGMPMPQPTRTGGNNGGGMRRGGDDIDDIIDDIHAEIITQPNVDRSRSPRKPYNFNKVETMSVSDEEITSIIEDTADLNGLLLNSGDQSRSRRGGKRGGGSARTLNL